MPEDKSHEVILLRQQLKAIRARIDQELDAIDARLIRMLPESALQPRRVITDWKKEVATW